MFKSSFELCQTGVPWRFNSGFLGMMRGLTKEAALEEAYKIEPLKPPFEPFVARGVVFFCRPDGSRDVLLEKALCK